MPKAYKPRQGSFANRRVATQPPLNKRVLNGRLMCYHLMLIKWTTMPTWYADFEMGRS
jgi:hypothetical protein